MAKPWYVAGFGEQYLELYAHRNQREAELAMRLLDRCALSLSGKRVLDLGCGAGRHLRILARRGAQAVGLDLSWDLLSAARGVAHAPRLIHGDMRFLPFADSSLDAVLSMFTSFGYFREDEENWGVLSEIARVLVPGGYLFLDFLNAAQVRANLKSFSRQEGAHFTAEEKRRIAGNRVEKEVQLSRKGSDKKERYVESVRLFEPASIVDKLVSLSLLETCRWGSYLGEEFQADGSPRFIILARKSQV